MALEYYRGQYVPQNPKKYVGNSVPIFRSSWEKRMFVWLDTNANVLKWASESVVIPYYFEIDQKIHNYVTDIYAEILDNSKTIKRYILEVKPKKQLNPPKRPKNNNGKALYRYSKEQQEFIRNKNKWDAARKFCAQNGLQFKILTEDAIF